MEQDDELPSKAKLRAIAKLKADSNAIEDLIHDPFILYSPEPNMRLEALFQRLRDRKYSPSCSGYIPIWILFDENER